MSYDSLNIKKAEAINLINERIEKGKNLFKEGASIIKGKSKYNISSRDRDLFESAFTHWVDITFSILIKIYKSSKYASEFHKKHSSKSESVSSSWIPDIEYYLTKQLIPKLDYLEMLSGSIDDFEEESNIVPSKSELDPWRVISAYIFNVNSYSIPGIIDRTGMKVNWNLTEKENYSDKYRKDAYRPRVNAEYDSLADPEKLRVAYIVASELFDRGDADDLNAALERIGWRIEAGRLTPAGADVKELFFPKGTHHDAYVEIRNLFQKANSSIVIVDPYLNSSVFKVLASMSPSYLSIYLLTFKIPTDFVQEAKKFLAQYSHFNLEARNSKEFHDRFIMLDNDEFWHLGCSIKDAGERVFMLSKIEDEGNRKALVEQFNDSWSRAQIISL